MWPTTEYSPKIYYPHPIFLCTWVPQHSGLFKTNFSYNVLVRKGLIHFSLFILLPTHLLQDGTAISLQSIQFKVMFRKHKLTVHELARDSALGNIRKTRPNTKIEKAHTSQLLALFGCVKSCQYFKGTSAHTGTVQRRVNSGSSPGGVCPATGFAFAWVPQNKVKVEI